MSTGHLVIRDTSPLVIYSPPLSSSEQNNGPDLSSGWVPYYTQSGFLTSNSPGTGVSQHITALDGANVSITWNGTGIQVMGNTTGSAGFALFLDNVDTPFKPNTSNVLVSLSNLTDTSHTITLMAQTSITSDLGSNYPYDSFIVFESANLVLSSSSSSSFESATNSQMNVAGSWTTVNANTTFPALFVSDHAGDSRSITFSGTACTINGTLSPDGGNYTVMLDNVTSSMRSTASPFAVPNTMLFFATDLSSSDTHTLEIVNMGGGTLSLPEQAFAVAGGSIATATSTSSTAPRSPSSSSSSSSSSTSGTPLTNRTSSGSLSGKGGTIAALVLGAVILFAVVAGVFIYTRIRRRRQQRQQQQQMGIYDPSSTPPFPPPETKEGDPESLQQLHRHQGHRPTLRGLHDGTDVLDISATNNHNNNNNNNNANNNHTKTANRFLPTINTHVSSAAGAAMAMAKARMGGIGSIIKSKSSFSTNSNSPEHSNTNSGNEEELESMQFNRHPSFYITSPQDPYSHPGYAAAVAMSGGGGEGGVGLPPSLSRAAHLYREPSTGRLRRVLHAAGLFSGLPYSRTPSPLSSGTPPLSHSSFSRVSPPQSTIGPGGVGVVGGAGAGAGAGAGQQQQQQQQGIAGAANNSSALVSTTSHRRTSSRPQSRRDSGLMILARTGVGVGGAVPGGGPGGGASDDTTGLTGTAAATTTTTSRAKRQHRHHIPGSSEESDGIEMNLGPRTTSTRRSRRSFGYTSGGKVKEKKAGTAIADGSGSSKPAILGGGAAMMMDRRRRSKRDSKGNRVSFAESAIAMGARDFSADGSRESRIASSAHGRSRSMGFYPHEKGGSGGLKQRQQQQPDAARSVAQSQTEPPPSSSSVVMKKPRTSGPASFLTMDSTTTTDSSLQTNEQAIPVAPPALPRREGSQGSDVPSLHQRFPTSVAAHSSTGSGEGSNNHFPYPIAHPTHPPTSSSQQQQHHHYTFARPNTVGGIGVGAAGNQHRLSTGTFGTGSEAGFLAHRGASRPLSVPQSPSDEGGGSSAAPSELRFKHPHDDGDMSNDGEGSNGIARMAAGAAQGNINGGGVHPPPHPPLPSASLSPSPPAPSPSPLTSWTLPKPQRPFRLLPIPGQHHVQQPLPPPPPPPSASLSPATQAAASASNRQATAVATSTPLTVSLPPLVQPLAPPPPPIHHPSSHPPPPSSASASAAPAVAQSGTTRSPPLIVQRIFGSTAAPAGPRPLPPTTISQPSRYSSSAAIASNGTAAGADEAWLLNGRGRGGGGVRTSSPQ